MNTSQLVQKFIEDYSEFDYSSGILNSIVNDFKEVSGAFSVIYNEFSLSENHTITRAISNSKTILSRLQSVSEINFYKKSYIIDPVVLTAIQSDDIVTYNSLFDISKYQLPEKLCSIIEKMYSLGKTHIVGLKLQNRVLGDLVFLMQKDVELGNRDLILMLAKHFSSLLLQYRKCQASFLQTISDHGYDSAEAVEITTRILALLDHGPDIIYQLDENGKIIFINHTVTKYGYSREDLIGRDALDLVLPEDRDKIRWNIKERRTGKRKTTQKEFKIVLKDKELLHLDTKETELSAIIMQLDAEGIYSSDKKDNSFIGTVGICRDVSRQRELENSLLEKDKILNYLTENLSDVIWIEQLDPPEMLYISESYSEIFGEMILENKNDTRNFMDRIHSEDRAKVEVFISSILSDTSSKEIQYRYLTDQDDYRWVHSKIYPIQDIYGRTNLLLGIASDISRQKNLETSLLNRIEQERMINREAHHRIKNNLFMIENIIKMEIDNCRPDDGNTIDKFRDLNARIISIEKLHKLLYEVKNPSAPNLNIYLQSVCDSVIKSLSSESKKISYSINADADYEVSQEQLLPIGMIISELLINSIKYAFDENTDNKIIINIKNSVDEFFIIELMENGKPFEITPAGSGLGLKMISALSDQLGGEFSYETDDDTKVFRLTLRAGCIEN